MRAVLHLAAYGLRARWRGWAMVVVLIAVAGGAVLSAVAGARRTDSAYPRFLQASNASGVLVSPIGTGLAGYATAALTRLPEVAVVAPVAALNTLAPVQVAAPADRRFGHLVDRPKVLTGRLPLPDRAGEVALDQNAVATLHLHVGSTLVVDAIRSDIPPSPAGARKLRERVVGIVVTRSSVKPVTELDKMPTILASTALMHDLGPRYLVADAAEVKLKPGTTLDSFRGRAEALARRFPATQGHVFVADEGTQAAAVQRAIRPEAVALALFALVLAVTALLIVGQAATRLLATSSPDTPALAALGMTRGQLMAAGLIKVGGGRRHRRGGGGRGGGRGVAADADRGGPAGRAGPRRQRRCAGAGGRRRRHRGAAGGAGGMAGVAQHIGRAPAGTVRPAAPGRRPRLTAWLAGAGAPVTAAAGVRLALEPGRGRTAVPVRAALAGTALSVLAVTAALTFGANLLHLVNTPPLYGQRWDAAIDVQFGADHSRRPTEHRLGHLPASPAGRSGITASSGSAAMSFRRSGWPRARARCCRPRCCRAARPAPATRSCSAPPRSARSGATSGRRSR